ncbi:MAG: polyprenyl synthetase family protein [Actinomycetes bacterium]
MGTLGAAAPVDYPDDLRQLADRYLEELSFPGGEVVPGLVEAMRYSLLAGGKRIRPVIAMATARALGHSAETVLPFAAAVEMIHTYSLIHDDLPAMDDDDLRRGQATLHKHSGEDVAILAGDCLYAEAFALLLGSEIAEPARVAAAAAELARATGVNGMVGGQFIDVKETAGVGLPGLVELHGLKTGRLIRASAECVNLLMDAPAETASAIGTYATELGILFQIVDDILDVTSSDEALGKPVGSDEALNKRTFVTELGVDEAKERASAHHASAQAALGMMGDEATQLRAIADYVWKRTS